MKFFSTIAILLITFFLLTNCTTRRLTKPDVVATAIKTPPGFRVVGYLLSGEIAKGKTSNLDVSKLTYLDIFFNAVDSVGRFKHLPHLDSTIAAAHKTHVIVTGSIGNAVSLSLLTDTNRAKFIDSLVSSIVALKLDGVDVDLEGPSINNNYEGFVNDLSAALHSKGKIISAAIATWESVKLTDKALACFDFLNVMTYDATGPWNLKEPGPHSPYSFAVSDLDFWTNTRHIAKGKLNLGLPFYGYGFGPDIQREFDYRQIVNTYPGAEKTDSVNVSAGNVIYYNGIPTIKQKTTFALQNAGGVMMWELMEDADGDKSLLNVVDEVIGLGK